MKLLSMKNALNNIRLWREAFLLIQSECLVWLFDNKGRHHEIKSGNDQINHLIYWLLGLASHNNFQHFILQAFCQPINACKWQGDSLFLKLQFYI